MKVLLKLGFDFGFNAVYKVTDLPWIVVLVATPPFAEEVTFLSVELFGMTPRSLDFIAIGIVLDCSNVRDFSR